jgi:hypothetical protein
MSCKAEIYQLAAALSALLLGLMVYLFERPADSIYLFALFSYSSTQHYDLLGIIGQSLPSIIHTYAFILLTVIAVGNGPRIIFTSSFLWVGIGWLFELGQHPTVSAQLIKHIPEWFSGIPLLVNSANYFQYGTFDPLDLLATLVGALAAWATYQMTRQKECNHETDK